MCLLRVLSSLSEPLHSVHSLQWLRFVVAFDAYRYFRFSPKPPVYRLRFSLMPPFKEAQENLQEGETSLAPLQAMFEAGQRCLYAELECLEERLDVNAEERDDITKKMSELYQSERFAEMDYLNGCLRSLSR